MSAIEEKVKRIIAKDLGLELHQVTRKTELEALGAEDLTAVALIKELEHQLEIKFTGVLADLDAWEEIGRTTVGEIVDCANSIYSDAASKDVSILNPEEVNDQVYWYIIHGLHRGWGQF